MSWYKLTCASIKDSDQPALQRSLVRVFDGCLIGRQVSIVSSTEIEERGGSVVECLNRDRGVAGSSILIVSWSKTHYPLLSTGLTQEDPSRHD